MNKTGLTFVAAFLTFFVTGCGSETPTASDSSQSSAAVTMSGGPMDSSASIPPATTVVSEFLDRVRRGGAAQVEAARLLTTRAQAECQRTGLQMGSMGSPDARFEVTRAESLPDSDDAVLVHTLWIEPTAEDKEATYQVVWAMQREPEGWRISGLVMEMEPGTEPIVVDFEDGDQAVAVLGLAGEPEARQASAPDGT